MMKKKSIFVNCLVATAVLGTISLQHFFAIY